MLQQAMDLREECDELYALLKGLEEEDWSRPTPFKSWTVNDVMAHLHLGDWMAVQSLTNPAGFEKILVARADARRRGETSPEKAGIGPSLGKGRALLEQWRNYSAEMCALLGDADPDARVKWVGPDMGVRMFATARQMETWAHGQDIYDLKRIERRNTDRIKNIAVIGCRTFGWTFTNRSLEVPQPVPYVRLTAPSGAIWEWHEPSDAHSIEGSAVDFAHVVTQGRNIADVNLTVIGEPATRWMAIAQCFAGPVEDPPAPGTRVWR